MHIESLELAGFKSFAQPTVLEFAPPKKGTHSITAVVGPNGSGKSNVVDALRWVMGEQSLKQIRGKKSHDMIFGGSDGKGQMSAATVTLTLDNSDKRAQIDYDQLVLQRKIYRDGEAKYLINGANVRLLDLQLLLAQAQFGQGAYSIIGQGVIDQLLLQSPSERKSFFDEAVGIKEFQLKRHHAMLKLERTHENMQQAGLLLSEIEPHLRSLKRQVKKLEQRQVVELELRELQEGYYRTLHDGLSNAVKSLKAQFSAEESEYAVSSGALSEVQQELALLAKESSGEERFSQLRAEYERLLSERATLERRSAVLSGKLSQEYSKEGKQNIGWLEQKISDLKAKKDLIESELRVAEKAHIVASDTLRSKERERSQAEQRRIALKSERADYEKRIQELRTGQETFAYEGLKAVSGVLSHIDQFDGNVYGTVSQLASVEEKFRTALEVAARSHLASVVVESDEVAERCIAYLKRERLGFATFLPLNRIKPRVVPKDILELLHKRGIYGLAIDLVNFDETFSDIFSYVFGSTLVVEDIETARKVGIGRVRMVTLDGDIMETSGSMKGGFRRRASGGLHFSSGSRTESVFGHQELEECEKSITLIETQLSESETVCAHADNELRTAQSEVQVSEGKKALIQEKMQEVVSELSSIEQERAALKLDPKEYSKLLKQLQGDKESLDTDLKDLQSHIDVAQEKMATFQEEQEKKRARVFELQEKMQAAQATLNEINARKSKTQIELVREETHLEDLEQELYDALKVGIGSLIERDVPAIHDRSMEQVKADIEKLSYKLSLIGGIDDEVMQEYEQTSGKFESLSLEMDDLEKASADLEALIAELDSMMKKKHEAAFKKIQKEFRRYFKILFDGGKADLVEVYGIEDDEQEDEEEEKPKRKRKKILKGIDVTACPPGKRIKHLQALSGGERTLTSIALVCAILHVNPPPFVILDEVEAALDEANTERFTEILRELAEHSQFIIITHNRVTMHAADRLYGVTMGSDGISQLVSVELDS